MNVRTKKIPPRSVGNGNGNGNGLRGLRLRLAVIGGALGLCSAALVVRAVDLQLVEKDFYQQQGNERFLREIPIATSRGMITDRNGEPLAVSTPVESVWADPQELLLHRDRLPELAEALGIPRKLLTQRLTERKDKEFVYLRRHMNPDRAQDILKLGVPGVFSQREFRRFYPLGETMAHVLGFTNIDDLGQEGLELAFDEWLTGKPGAKRVIRDRRGRIVENVDLIRPAQPGRPLTLSIDRRIQHLAYRGLKHALQEHDASSGSVVVLDVKTGEILAMVNQPSYNPNARAGSDTGSRRNRAVTDVVEPGSVVKAITVIAALETGEVKPDTIVETSPGYITLGGRYTVRDIRNFGTLNVTRIITKSSNVGSIKLSMGMDSDHLYDVFHRFGFGEATGSGFPGESAGVLAPPQRWGPVEKAAVSYGYGLSVTPLQVAQAYAAIGNGGRLTTPTFVKRDPDAGGQNARQVIDPEIARSVLAMLETVTGPEGSARRASVSGYRVAGKTGSSRKASAGGYQRKYISLFAGLVPVSDPRFAMAVVINDPKGSAYYGGLVSAPVFHEVMDGTLRLMDVPPDNVEEWLVAQPPEPPPPETEGGLPPEAEIVPDAPGGAGPQ